MELVNCWSCSEMVSPRAGFCPNPDCGIERPAQHGWHVEQEAVRRDVAASRGYVSSLEHRLERRALIEAVAAELGPLWDAASRDAALARMVRCPDCKTHVKLSLVLGWPCPTCGNPDVQPCEMPGAPCGHVATRLERVSGRWLAICRHHKRCRTCERIIDESRFEARTEGKGPPPVPAAHTMVGFGLRRAPRERIHTHADPGVCEALGVVAARFSADDRAR